MKIKRPPRFFPSGCEYTEKDRKNLRRVNLSTFAWVMSWLAASLAIDRFVDATSPLAYVLASIAILLGLQVIRSYVHFLRQADELVGKIQMEALAIGFGAGAIFMVGYPLCVRLGAPPLDFSDALIVMVLVWALGQLVVARRYR